MSVCPDDPPLPGLSRHMVWRHAGPAPGAAEADWLADEVPVALVFNGLSHAVMMATPDHLDDFALGFALSEGILQHPDECRDLEQRPAACRPGGETDAFEVLLEISPRRLDALKRRRRALAGRTGCGVCGLDSLQALQLRPPPLPPPDWLPRVDAAFVHSAMARLPALQPLHAAAGAVHGAAWAPLDPSAPMLAREDVGRHNALDKLIGALAREGRLGEPGVVLMSSRASHELVAKCAQVGLAALATVSAPTALGVRAAQAAGLRLWGLCRPPRAVLYAGAECGPA